MQNITYSTAYKTGKIQLKEPFGMMLQSYGILQTADGKPDVILVDEIFKI